MRKLFYSIILTMIGVIIFIPKVYAIPNYESVSYRLVENYDNGVAKLEIGIGNSYFNNYSIDLEINYYNYTDDNLIVVFPKVFTVIMADVDDYDVEPNSNNILNVNYYVKYLLIDDSGVVSLYNIHDNLLYNFPLSYEFWLYIQVDDTLTYQDGYDAGLLEGRKDYGFYENGVWYTAKDYAINEFDRGYSKALEDSGDLKLAIKDFVPGILGSIFMFFFTLSSMSILGISILEVLVLVFGVGAIIFVIKLIF